MGKKPVEMNIVYRFMDGNGRNTHLARQRIFQRDHQSAEHHPDYVKKNVHVE